MSETSSSKTDTYHHGDLESVIMQHALEGILERGVSGLSLREVARRAGVSHGAPAHHFKDKAGLLTALATQGFLKMNAAMVSALDEAPDNPVERFKLAGKTYVRFAAQNKAYFELMFRPEFHYPDDAGLLQAALSAREILLEQTKEIHAAGLSNMDPEALALRGWSTAHGLSQLWIAGNISPQYREEELELVLDSVFEGGELHYINS